MALSIKDPEADRLARELAARTGETLTEAVIVALRERLARQQGRLRALPLREELATIRHRCAALPVLDDRTSDAILGYDGHGLPQLMVIDTSALVAMLCAEPDAALYEAAVEADPVRLMSTASYLETAIVIESRYGEPGGRELDLWLHRADVQLVAVSVEQAEIARVAYRKYGKGRHPAGLNYGDCFAYALTHTSGEPLLFKGEDFPHTDLRPAALVAPQQRRHED